MQSLALRPLKLDELKELEESSETNQNEVDEEEEEEEEMFDGKKRKKLVRTGRRGCTLGGFLLVLLLLGGLTAGVCLALKMLKVPVDYGAPLRETRATFETVRHRLKLILTSLDDHFLKRSQAAPTSSSGNETTSTPSPPVPSLILPLATLKSILAAHNTTLESVAAKYCSPSLEVGNIITAGITNVSEAATAPELLLAFSCSTIDWAQLADQIRQALDQAESAVQVSLRLEDEEMHLSVGHFPPAGGSLSILKASGGQLFQVEMASSEEAPEVRLEVAWILPLTGGKHSDNITLLMVTPDQRYCLLELFGARQLSCKLINASG